jgi:hypothetical protein
MMEDVNENLRQFSTTILSPWEKGVLEERVDGERRKE